MTDLESESESEDSDTEELNIPLVPIIRGQAKSKVRPKHRLATSKTCALQAVSRGQIIRPKFAADEVEWVWVDKKGMVPRKRFYGGETGPPEIEARGRQEHKHKKLKVETGFAKDTNRTFQAISRGQITRKHDTNSDEVEWVWVAKKGMVPKKRARETKGVEDQGLKGKQKKTKV